MKQDKKFAKKYEELDKIMTSQRKHMQKMEEEEQKAVVTYKDAEIKIKYILGKVLTIVEASALNPQQAMAVKSLIKHVFSEELTKLYNWTHPSSHLLSEADMVDENGSMEQFYEDNQETTLNDLADQVGLVAVTK